MRAGVRRGARQVGCARAHRRDEVEGPHTGPRRPRRRTERTRAQTLWPGPTNHARRYERCQVRCAAHRNAPADLSVRALVNADTPPRSPQCARRTSHVVQGRPRHVCRYRPQPAGVVAGGGPRPMRSREVRRTVDRTTWQARWRGPDLRLIFRFGLDSLWAVHGAQFRGGAFLTAMAPMFHVEHPRTAAAVSLRSGVSCVRSPSAPDESE